MTRHDRYQTSNFLAWLNRDGRKPLVMRGARQVGKTWLVRECARRAGLTLAEVNFERNPTFARYFESNDPARIVRELSLALGSPIRAESAILFLDEVQAAAEVLPKLRWFAEELPALPVVATGSLLHFALGEMAAGMPVGRDAGRPGGVHASGADEL